MTTREAKRVARAAWGCALSLSMLLGFGAIVIIVGKCIEVW